MNNTIQSINPLDILENGTKVRIGRKEGVVTGHRIANAIPCGKIVIHTVHLTLKYATGVAHKSKPIAINEKWEGNYSAIRKI